MLRFRVITIVALAQLLVAPAFGESQGSDYQGVTDPFGDPANYEFAEDEKEDKEFFHLGRFIMIGLDGGVAIFTGGLGQTNDPSPYVGLRLLYFFDRSISLELAGHYSNHLDIINPSDNQLLEIDTNMIPVTLGFRYYFDTRSAPKAIAVANPYIPFGAGLYMRTQNVVNVRGFKVSVSDTMTSHFGAYAGAGVEFAIYRRHLYLGIDARFHLVFFSDENDTWDSDAVDRSGDYVTTNFTLTYNF